MRKLSEGVFVFAAGLALALSGVAFAGGVHDDDYQSRVTVKNTPPSVDSDDAESPMGRLEARRATVGGDVAPQARVNALAEAKRIQQKKAPTVGGAWTS